MRFPVVSFSRRTFLQGLAISPLAHASSPIESAPTKPCVVAGRVFTSPNLEKFFLQLEPGSDAFQCEKYAAELERIFQDWRAALCSPGSGGALHSAFLAPDLEFTALGNSLAKPLSTSKPIEVETIEFLSGPEKGRASFLASLRAYFRGVASVQTAEFQIPALRISGESPLKIEVDVRYNFVLQHAADTREERVGVWSLECQAAPDGKWIVQRWRATTETRARLKGRGFVDVTEHALRGNTEALEQFRRGVDYWRSRIDGASGIDVYGNNGVAVGDFDGDGLDDLYVCQPSGLPNRLFRNRGDGTFEDVTATSGLGLLDGTAAALFADFTNSGSQDLIVVRTSGPLLYLNRGKGKYELKRDAFRFAQPPSGTFTGLAAADYDRDGRLDIYFCLYAYYQGLSQYTHPSPYYDAQNGPPNFLMRNRGEGVFEDATAASRMGVNNNRFTFACGWCDYDNDGWPDLFVANDFGRKNLYRNNRDGTFRDVAQEAGVEDYGAGMSVSWFDVENDGRQDLYVTDMFSAAGTRVTGQDAFLPGVDKKIRAAYRKHAAGNSLFANTGNTGGFSDVTQPSHTGMGRWSWSGDTWDFDHDGQSDLYVTNGFISGTKRPDLASFFWRQIVSRSLDSGGSAVDYQLAWNAINELIRADYSWNGHERNVFFLNAGNGRFAEVSGCLGLDFVDDSRAFALADFDGDGRLEMVLKNRTGPQLRVLRNEMENIGNSVSIRLRGTTSNRDAIGATVSVQSASGRQVKFVQAGSGFLSQHTKTLSFGLGVSTDPVTVTVHWPGGNTQHFENVPAQHLVSIDEGRGDFSAAPFAARKTAVVSPLPEDREESRSYACRLLEPLPAFDFSLPCTDGRTLSLKSFQGRPLLLALIRGECEASQAMVRSLAEPEKPDTRVAALYLGPEGKAPDAPFPVLLADATTTGVYSILYRYLFDRRRDLETPLLLALDAQQNITAISSSVKELREQATALPFPGRFHADPPRRNFFTYGVAFVQNEYPDAALKCFEIAAARNPTYAPAYYNMGTIYLNKQKLPEAKRNLERAVALDPQDADALTNLGAVAGQQKDYDAAYRYFEQALEARPTHLVALQNVVMLDRWKGQLGKAQQTIERAIAAQPDDPEFRFALGMLLAGQDKFDEARKQLERTVALRPGDTVALNNLGVVYLRLNKTTEAARCFERCITLAPDYDRPFLNLASVYQQQGNVAKAQELLRNFLARHPDNKELAEALGTLGQ